MPPHILRYSNREAIDKLAARFGLPNDPGMQDWEYEVADDKRIDEFLAAYETTRLSDDERFTLMQTIIESFEGLARGGRDLASDSRWQRTLTALNGNIPLHAYSVWHYSCPDADNEEELFYVSPFIRQILAAHQDYFADRGTCR